MKTFARFKNDIWCMVQAYVEKLANDNKGLKYLLGPQDLFDRSADAKGMKIKDYTATVRAFQARLQMRSLPGKVRLTRDGVCWRV